VSDACANDPVGLILTLADQLHHQLEHVTRRIGLTAPQAKLLVHLDEPCRMSDLAGQQSCDPSSITSLVDRLERDGLVKRVADPDDGRVRLVTLTAAGRRMRQRFLDEVSTMPDPFASLTADQRSALVVRLQVPEGTPTT